MTKRRRVPGAAGILLAGILIGSLTTGIATGHFEPSTRHIIKHAKRVFLTKKAAAAGYAPVRRLTPGVTVTGAFGGWINTAASWEEVVSFPARSRKALADEDINFPTSEPNAIIAEQSDRCTGTAAKPTAPPGMVCVYASSYDGGVMALDGEILTGARNRGFVVIVTGESAGRRFYGSWAYTEPR